MTHSIRTVISRTLLFAFVLTLASPTVAQDALDEDVGRIQAEGVDSQPDATTASGDVVDDSASTGSLIPINETEEQRIRRLLDEAFAQRPASLAVNQQQGINADGGFVLSPGSFYEAADPGEQIELTMSLLNKSGEDVIYEISVTDLGVDQNTGSPVVYKEGADGPFPARKWIKPAVSELPMHHGEHAFIPITIDVPEKVDAGDRMAAVRLKKRRLSSKTGGIKVNAYTSVLFVITVRGDVVIGAEFESFGLQKYLNWSLPIDLYPRVRNTGTVHVAPKGTIEIKNIFGITVDEITIPRWHVLRESSHAKRVTWKPKFALGRYTAHTNIQLDSKMGSVPIEQHVAGFWVVPLIPLLVTVAAIFLVSFIVQFFFSRFEIRMKKKPKNAE